MPSIPSEKALGSLRPLTRWNPRSLVVEGPVSASRLFLNTRPPSSGASTGARPARSAIPGTPPDGALGPSIDRAASDPVSGCMLAARFRYQRKKTIATRSNTARPATPPTIPPANSEAGGVLLLLLSLLAPDSVEAEPDAEAVAVAVIEPAASDDEAAEEVVMTPVLEVELDEGSEEDAVDKAEKVPYEVLRSPLERVVIRSCLAKAMVARAPSDKVVTVEEKSVEKNAPVLEVEVLVKAVPEEILL